MKRKNQQAINTYLYLRTLNISKTDYTNALQNLQTTWDRLITKNKQNDSQNN